MTGEYKVLVVATHTHTYTLYVCIVYVWSYQMNRELKASSISRGYLFYKYQISACFSFMPFRFHWVLVRNSPLSELLRCQRNTNIIFNSVLLTVVCDFAYAHTHTLKWYFYCIHDAAWGGSCSQSAHTFSWHTASYNNSKIHWKQFSFEQRNTKSVWREWKTTKTGEKKEK